MSLSESHLFVVISDMMNTLDQNTMQFGPLAFAPIFFLTTVISQGVFLLALVSVIFENLVECLFESVYTVLNFCFLSVGFLVTSEIDV